MHWTERRRAVTRIGVELRQRGWNIHGYKEDRSDAMTDYFDPASWDGIATHPNHPNVVVCVDVSSANKSGKQEIETQAVPDQVCPRCNGDKLDPLGWTLDAARAEPERYHQETIKAKYGPNSNLVPLMSRVISPIPFDGNRLKCLKCHGEGHTFKTEEVSRWTWPEFHATPKGKTWHVERDGEIVKTGVGLRKCADWDQVLERGNERAQSAAEVALDPFLLGMSGAEWATGIGLNRNFTQLYPEAIILDDDLYHRARYAMTRMEINADTLAVDTVCAVGPGGHFLAQKHTRKRIRDFRLPLLEQDDAEGNPRDPREVALEEFKRLHETHHPEFLPDEVLAELDRILAAAEGEVEGMG